MKKISKIEDVDKYMKVNDVDENSIIYYNPKDNNNFKIEGLAFFDKDHEYFRLPLNCKNDVTEAVYWLASQPSGGQIHFKTNAKKILLKIKNKGDYTMCHMAKTGQQGADLYYRLKGKKNYTFFTCCKFNVPAEEFDSIVFESDSEDVKDIIINLPLYEGMESILIGLNKNAKLFPFTFHKNEGRIVVYGTSITQGGCASRPGMSYTNILSRKLDYEFINLGFSGSGLGEEAIAKIIATIENITMLILDYDANGGATKDMLNNLEPFIDIFRNKYKNVPIIIISKPPFANGVFKEKDILLRQELFDFQKNMVFKKKNQGDNNIYFVDGNTLFGKKDIYEGLVDGIHPTDLGFYRMANNLMPIIKKILHYGK